MLLSFLCSFFLSFFFLVFYVRFSCSSLVYAYVFFCCLVACFVCLVAGAAARRQALGLALAFGEPGLPRGFVPNGNAGAIGDD